ncbi:hypothetical protein [Streptomyces lavendulae]|uniref:hypothetical protein n=1 Tax=Streptomyces lavendulae TaxID=1914 RepID=UPI0024A428ED|nr:hypothetical protein [Streptomyces lavendulae]GLW02545.1 hypothetical protein Slala05_61750 [Streptomyces lavendulae subsp. lavendulae]
MAQGPACAPHQITALARCLTEAAAVRTGRRLAGAHPVTVLSAGEALHTTAGLLGGPHARYVHEINTTEDPLLRFLGRITSWGRDRVTLLAPTDQVRDDLASLFPHVPCRNRPFAVADPGDRISETERCAAPWRSGIREDLTRRYQHSLDGSWQTDSPAIPTEAWRLLDHLDQHDGRIDVHDQDLSFRPVSLTRTPSWWAEEATSIVDTWRPPANNHSQSGPTIPSPSP